MVWIWGWYKLWLRYLLGIDVPRAHYVKSLVYRFFLSKPDTVLRILSGFCPVCGRRFKNNFDAYYHFTRYTKCGGSLYEVFSSTVRCEFVDMDLAYMMFPFNVIDVYRSYARRAICLGQPPSSFDGRRVLVNIFDFDRCSLKSHNVAYFIECRDRSVPKSVEGVGEGGDG